MRLFERLRYIQLYFNWRCTFIFLALYGLACLILVWLFIPETSKYRTSTDVKSITANFAEICKHRGFMLMTFSTSMLYAMVALFSLQGSFIIQNKLHYNSGIYGLSAFSCGLSYMLGSFISVHFSLRQRAFLAFSISILASISLIFVGEIEILHLAIFLLPVLAIMFSCGLILPRIMQYTLSLFRKQAGTASAVFGALVMLGMSLFLVITGMLDSTISYLGFSYLVLTLIIAISLLPGKLHKHL